MAEGAELLLKNMLRLPGKRTSSLKFWFVSRSKQYSQIQ